MAKTDKTGQQALSVEQENAVDLLLQGKSDREVAEVVGVVRQTVTTWRNENEAFRAALNARRQEVFGAASDRLRNLLARSLDVLEENLGADADPKLRQDAAIHILRATRSAWAGWQRGTDKDPA